MGVVDKRKTPTSRMKPKAISMELSVSRLRRTRIWRLVDKTDEEGGRGMTDDLIAKKCQVKSKKKTSQNKHQPCFSA